MSVKKKIGGAFDLLMLFGRGIEAFSGSRRDALLSVIIPAALFPFTLVFCALHPPKGMESGFTVHDILTTVSLQAILSTVLSLGLIIAFAWTFDRLDRFWLYLEASNWVALATFIAVLPFIITAVLGWSARVEMDRVFALIQCYFYVVSGCIFFRTFRINWKLAGFMAVAMLFANQITWDLLLRIRGIAIPW